MSDRYKVVEGSQSCHCCFAWTVVDTTRPVMIGDQQYEDQSEPICETFKQADAVSICAAMNAVCSIQ